MKISVNWMQQLAPGVTILPRGGIDELVQKIGAQLGAVEEVNYLGDRYTDIVVAKIAECKKHPNADKLHVCKIDDGGMAKGIKRDEKGLIQVVCGAPEVRTGLTVAWIPPGALVPSTANKDELRLESREIRGVVSEGMLGTPHELALSDDHSALLLVDDKIKPGTALAEVYGLNDYVIDIENKMFTHRPDLFGILGVAREIAGINHQQFTSPAWYMESAKYPELKGERLPLRVVNDVPELVPRVMAVVINDITIQPSPLWLQSTLTKVGIRPINNIVDITNYMMHLTSQPMHAFDYHKIKLCSGTTPTIGPRLAKNNEIITLLGGKKLSLTDNDIVLATDKQAIDLAGVMGGAHTEVDATTKAIVLTVCSFDMYAVRRSSMRHGVFTDASTRYTKNQSPLQNDRVLLKALEMINEQCTSRQASEVFDIKGNFRSPIAVHVTAKFINARLGLSLDIKEMAILLANVEFKTSVNGPTLAVTPPFWRTDIEIPEDIVEEVGRLYGFDRLPLKLPKRDLTPARRDELLSFKQRLRHILARAGANEALTYNFVHGNLLDRVGQDRKLAFELSNALSPDLQYYRLDVLPSLLDKVHANIKAGYDEFALFEMNKAHSKLHSDDDAGLPTEFNMLALVYAANDKLNLHGAAYYQARAYLDYLANQLEIELVYVAAQELDYPVFKPYDISRTALVTVKDTDITLGLIGEFKRSVINSLKLPNRSAGFEVGTKELLQAAKNSVTYQNVPKFPKVTQDISLKVPVTMSFAVVDDFVQQNLQVSDAVLVSFMPLDIYQGADKTTKNITFRLTVASFEKTLTDQEVNKLLDDVSSKAGQQLGVKRV